MADYKPADLFLGVFEIFGILLPGSALIFLIDDHFSSFRAPLPLLLSSYGWIAFLVAAYFAGQLLRMLGYVFELLYKHFRYRKIHLTYKDLADLVQEKIRSRYGITCTGKDLYYFAGSAVRAAIPAATQELDRRGAEYKFFRSAILVLFVAALVLWTPLASTILVVLALFSFGQFPKSSLGRRAPYLPVFAYSRLRKKHKRYQTLKLLLPRTRKLLSSFLTHNRAIPDHPFPFLIPPIGAT